MRDGGGRERRALYTTQWGLKATAEGHNSALRMTRVEAIERPTNAWQLALIAVTGRS